MFDTRIERYRAGAVDYDKSFGLNKKCGQLAAFCVR